MLSAASVVHVTSSASATLRLGISFPAPADLSASLRPLGRWGDDGIDRWDGATAVRTVRVGTDRHVVPYVARVTGGVTEPRFELRIPAAAGVPVEAVAELVRASFVADPAALAALAAADQRVARLAQLYPGLLPVLIEDPFSALVRSISAQQVNLPWAAIIRRRLAEHYGTRHEVDGSTVFSLHPEPLAGASIEELRALQLTTAKSRAVIDCARAAQAGELEPARLEAFDVDGLIDHLTRLRGIGRWSAEWFLARTLGRPIVVAGDLGVRKAVGRMYGQPTLPSEDGVRRLTVHWGAAAAIAQALALHDLAVASGTA